MTFSQVFGHEPQKDLLRRALQSGRLAHAYLFEGPDGVGKQLLALALVRALFCTQGTGCGTCAACRKVDHHNHPDLHLLEPDGGVIRIEQVREIQRELAFRPLEARQKICLIDNAEAMNTAAANALLKTLEEPPGDALLILLSARPDSLLPTIRSRCQRIPFGRLPHDLLSRLLMERLELDTTEAHLLSALSEGSLKKALGRDRELYLNRRPELLKAVAGMHASRISPISALATRLAEDKEQLPDLLDLLQSYLRDQLLHRQGRPDRELVNIDLVELIRQQAANRSTTQLLDQLDALTECRRQLQRNVNRQLALEHLLLKLAA